MIRMRDPKTGKSLFLKIPAKIDDVSIDFIHLQQFKQFAEDVLRNYKKIKDPFSIEETLKFLPSKKPDWRTAYKYLKILEYNRLVKPTQASPYPAYILACETPVEEFQAEAESIGSILAAVGYDRVKAFCVRRPFVASILLYRLSKLANRLPLIREEGLIPTVRERLGLKPQEVHPIVRAIDKRRVVVPIRTY